MTAQERGVAAGSRKEHDEASAAPVAADDHEHTSAPPAEHVKAFTPLAGAAAPVHERNAHASVAEAGSEHWPERVPPGQESKRGGALDMAPVTSGV